jgi:GntR family transcriptional regulator
VFRRVSYAAGTPLEYVVSRYRGDRYQIHMSLGRDEIGPSSTNPRSTNPEGTEH